MFWPDWQTSEEKLSVKPIIPPKSAFRKNLMPGKLELTKSRLGASRPAPTLSVSRWTPGQRPSGAA